MAYSTTTDLEMQIDAVRLNQLASDRVVYASGQLSGALTVDGTVLTLAATKTFPDVGVVRIGTEKISYTAKTPTTLTGAIRGVESTVAQVHIVTEAVVECLEAVTTVVARAITDADSLIDSYCRKVVSVLPFSPVPDIVRKLSVDIAIYNLFTRRGRASEDDVRRYEDAVKYLKDISTGKASFGADESDVTFDDKIVCDSYIEDRMFTTSSKTRGTTGTMKGF